ncbi:MAG: hypothetical protein ABW135_07970 [Thermoleophilaceae bacterium]|jgi:hypothetical protein
MKMLEALRKRRSDASRRETEPTASSPDESHVPIPGYDRLNDKEIGARLPQLSQVELAAVETYERANGNRTAVLHKLRYMRGDEPLPEYDTLTTDQIAEAMADADSETVRAVRDYERKFQHRSAVLDEAARVLPSSPASAREVRTRDEKAELLREGYADRARTKPDPE